MYTRTVQSTAVRSYRTIRTEAVRTVVDLDLPVRHRTIRIAQYGTSTCTWDTSLHLFHGRGQGYYYRYTGTVVQGDPDTVRYYTVPSCGSVVIATAGRPSGRAVARVQSRLATGS